MISHEQYNRVEEDFAEMSVTFTDDVSIFRDKYKLTDEQMIELLKADIKFRQDILKKKICQDCGSELLPVIDNPKELYCPNEMCLNDTTIEVN